MSEKSDLWVPAVLLLGGVTLFVWNLVSGSVWLGLLAFLVGTVGAGTCLPLRLRRGQARVVAFGAGVGLLLVPLVPGVGGHPATVLPWVIAGFAFVLPPVPRSQPVRRAFLVAAGVLAILALLAIMRIVPPALTWLFLSAAFFAATLVVGSRPRREPVPPPGPRVCLMGGSFDPFHNGHRALAQAALRVVDRLLVIPAGKAPHKQGQGREATDFHHRVAMARLGVEGFARTEVLELEGRRSGPSYTVDTLDVIRRTHPAGTRFLLLIGADMYQEFPTWREWERIIDLATLLVARRPGWDLEPPPEFDGQNVSIEVLEAPEMDVSSRALRAELAVGKSVGDRITPAVQAYIREHHLYE